MPQNLVLYNILIIFALENNYYINNNTLNTMDLLPIIERYGYTVTSIAPRVFYGNTTLETVSIPDSVNTIGLYAFAFCSNLKSISLGENGFVI